jgi:hypothetical protein
MPPPPIITAATSGDTKQIRKILEADATKIHAVGSNGNFPLHVCVQKETAANVSAIKILLEFGADPTAENDNGDTPLAIAQKNKFTKMLPMLEDGAAAAEERAAAERKARMEAKAAAAKKKAEEGGGDSSGGALKFRRVANVGWKPLKTDWEKLVKLRKPLTDDFKGRKISITFSNKTADAAFAKGLDAALREAEADSRLIQKWPVNGWVQGCVFAADEADFVIVLHSANYDEGHYCVAERYLVSPAALPRLQHARARDDVAGLPPDLLVSLCSRRLTVYGLSLSLPLPLSLSLSHTANLCLPPP